MIATSDPHIRLHPKATQTRLLCVFLGCSWWHHCPRLQVLPMTEAAVAPASVHCQPLHQPVEVKVLREGQTSGAPCLWTSSLHPWHSRHPKGFTSTLSFLPELAHQATYYPTRSPLPACMGSKEDTTANFQTVVGSPQCKGLGSTHADGAWESQKQLEQGCHRDSHSGSYILDNGLPILQSST